MPSPEEAGPSRSPSTILYQPPSSPPTVTRARRSRARKTRSIYLDLPPLRPPPPGGRKRNHVPLKQRKKEQIEQDYRDRTVKSWVSRRANDAERERVEGRIGLRELLSPDSSVDQLSDLPENELLYALVFRAGQYYHHENLMGRPKAPWEKKAYLSMRQRRLGKLNHRASEGTALGTQSSELNLIDGAGEGEIDELAAGSGVEEKGGESGEGEETDEGAGDGDGTGVIHGSPSAAGSMPPESSQGGPANGEKVKRGEYRQKDMYRALDGKALIAFGILVEQYLAHQLGVDDLRPGRRGRAGSVVLSSADEGDQDDLDHADQEAEIPTFTG